MNDIALIPIEEIISELKRRDLSFVIAYVNHVEFHKQDNNEIVWGMDHGGNLPLKLTLTRLLSGHMEDIEKHARTRWAPPATPTEEEDIPT